MTKTPLIIDCDPGQDDAINLFMAFAARDAFDILGITTVAGNVGLDKTTRNARILCEIAGHTNIPVHAGCDAPLHYPLATAEEVHGQDGLDGVESRGHRLGAGLAAGARLGGAGSARVRLAS